MSLELAGKSCCLTTKTSSDIESSCCVHRIVPKRRRCEVCPDAFGKISPIGRIRRIRRFLGERQTESYLPEIRMESEAPAELGFGSAGASPSRYKPYCRSPYPELLAVQQSNGASYCQSSEKRKSAVVGLHALPRLQRNVRGASGS